MGRIFFDVPNDQDLMKNLVQKVPSNWLWVDGGLLAPKRLFISKDADARLVVESGRYRPHGVVNPPLPGIAHFSHEGYGDLGGIEFGKNLIVRFLDLGYRGRLFFYRDFTGEFLYNNSARCVFEFKPDGGSRIMLVWDERHGGSEGSIAEVSSACHALGLTEFEPSYIS